jgi:hypothetical protein
MKMILIGSDESITEDDEKFKILKFLFDSGVKADVELFLSDKFLEDDYSQRRKIILKMNEKYFKK